MRNIKWLALVIMVLAVGSGAVSADDNTHKVADNQLYILDGRVNSWDVAAPVAVYCRFDYPYADDVNMSVLTSIEVLGINYANNGELLFSVDAAAIDAAGTSPAQDTLLGSGGGTSLYRATDGQFYIVGPANEKGEPYIFTWERGTQGC